MLESADGHVTTDHVLMETWLLLSSRFGTDAADRFWDACRSGPIRIDPVMTVDLEAAWASRSSMPDLPLVDRTSVAVMDRLGIDRMASLSPSAAGSAPRKQWRGIDLGQIRDAALGEGPWQTSKRITAQRAVETVYLDADPTIPGQPGRVA
jgi:hypothetical protein